MDNNLFSTPHNDLDLIMIPFLTPSPKPPSHCIVSPPRRHKIIRSWNEELLLMIPQKLDQQRLHLGVCTDIRNMWDFHLQNHQHFDTFVKDFKEKRLKVKLKYEHKISHVSYVRAHPKWHVALRGNSSYRLVFLEFLDHISPNDVSPCVTFIHASTGVSHNSVGW